MCVCKVMDVLMRREESFHSIYGIQVRNKKNWGVYGCHLFTVSQSHPEAERQDYKLQAFRLQNHHSYPIHHTKLFLYLF